MYNKNMKNTIYIIGAGAIGKALAVFLKLQGKHPILIRGSVDDHSSYTQVIYVELADGTRISADILVATAVTYTRFDNLVVFTNKAFGNLQLAEHLKAKIGDTPIVILQNGLTVEQPFIDNGYPCIYRCVLFTSCQFTDTGSIKFKPAKPSRIGVIRDDLDRLEWVVDQLNNDHLQFEAEPDIQPVIWTKAIANCVFNSICPLLEIDNGVFHRNEKALAIAKRVIAECIIIAGSVNVHLRHDQVLKTLLHISETSDGQRISTYQDILHNRQTEIDTLNLAIAEIARKSGNMRSVKETRLLGELIAVKSGLRNS
jgi:2-dehydropantoate 2-reductase